MLELLSICAGVLTYSLSVNISGMAPRTKEVPIAPGVVKPIQFTLPQVEICLSQRPSLGHGEPIKVIPDLDQFVVRVLKRWVDFSFSVLT